MIVRYSSLGFGDIRVERALTFNALFPIYLKLPKGFLTALYKPIISSLPNIGQNIQLSITLQWFFEHL